MRLLKLNSVFILLLVTFSMQSKSQQVINDVTIEKKGSSLYRIQYSLNQTADFTLEKAILKIYRRRNGNVAEIFSVPVTIPPLNAQNHQPYNFDWTASSGLIQQGDDLQAKIILTLKTSLARQKLNRIPIANAGEFMQAEFPVTKPVELNGSKSRDDDGKIVDIEWKQVGGPTNLNIARKDSLIAYADGEFKTGTYAFEITIKDNLGSVSSSRTSLTVKAPSYWTNPPVNHNQQKTKTGQQTTPQKNQTKLKGGPSNAALNLLLPGVGHYFVSGDYNGKNRKATSFIITGVYIGSLAGAVVLNQKSDQEFEKYTELVNFREYQKDANGNIIGIRGGNEAQANDHYSKGQSLQRNAMICLGVGGAVLAGDLVYTFIRGNKNKKEWTSANTSFKPNLFISSDGMATNIGIQLKF
jgi:hypothetical protein